MSTEPRKRPKHPLFGPFVTPVEILVVIFLLGKIAYLPGIYVGTGLVGLGFNLIGTWSGKKKLIMSIIGCVYCILVAWVCLITPPVAVRTVPALLFAASSAVTFALGFWVVRNVPERARHR